MRCELKQYERGADFSKTIQEGTLHLAGVDVFLNDGETIYECSEFTEKGLSEDYDIKGGTWYVEDGWVVGKNPNCCPGMLVSKKDYCGHVLLEVTVKMVSPSTHDINIMINGSWDEKKNRRDLAYVTGLEAFWHGNIGFEKSPEYKLTAATQLFDFNPNREYRLQFCNTVGMIFVLADQKLALEITDPDPIDVSRYGKFGFEAFSSWWKFKNVKLKKLSYKMVQEKYIPEF